MNKYDLTITKLHQMVKEGIVPGVSYLIFDRQHTIKEVTGMAQVYPETEILKPGMLYDVASLTKVIGTVPVVAMLIQKGALSLDDPVKKFLPEFNDDRPTIRNLLTHTSGITGYIPHRNELDAVALKKAFLTKMHVEDSLNRQIKYADVNYLYLGWIIERIYDQPVQNVITEQVLKPLNLRIDTYRSSGAGGQHINKTSSAVRITHIPTGIVVQCQNERSQFQNKDKAMQMLKAKLYMLKQQENEKKLSGIQGELTEIGWGNQIRSYVMQPYTMVKDHRTNEETGNVDAVMNGSIDNFINAYLKWSALGKKEK